MLATAMLMVRSAIVCDAVRVIHIDSASGHLAAVDSMYLGEGVIVIGHECDMKQKPPATREVWEHEQRLPGGWSMMQWNVDVNVRPWVGCSFVMQGIGRTSFVECPLILLTVFFAILPVKVVVSADRETRRRRRGECGRCGYDLTGNTSGVCPECGTSVMVATK